jgi:hypothetical protein
LKRAAIFTRFKRKKLMENQSNLEKSNKLNTIIFYAMFAGQALFLIVASYLVKTSGPQSPDLSSAFQIILPVFTIGAVISAMFLPKKILGAIDELSDDQKIIKHRTTSLIKWALLEGANLFSIVVYLLTGSMLALAISVLLLILFMMNKPSVDKTKEELSL